MKVAKRLAYTLSVMAIVGPIQAATPSAVLELRREQAVESAIDGCTRAIEDGVVTEYMKRRADAENPAASEAEARSEIESLPGWKDQMLPDLQKNCACLFDAPLSELRNASTDDELDVALTNMREMQTSSFVSELESKAPSCFSVEPKK